MNRSERVARTEAARVCPEFLALSSIIWWGRIEMHLTRDEPWGITDIDLRKGHVLVRQDWKYTWLGKFPNFGLTLSFDIRRVIGHPHWHATVTKVNPAYGSLPRA